MTLTDNICVVFFHWIFNLLQKFYYLLPIEPKILIKEFPFSKYFEKEINILNKNESSIKTIKETLDNLIAKINEMFIEIKECHIFELIRNNNERGNYLIAKQAKIIAMTCSYAAMKRKDFIELGFEFNNIIVEEAAQILDIETFIPLMLQKN